MNDPEESAEPESADEYPEKDGDDVARYEAERPPHHS